MVSKETVEKHLKKCLNKKNIDKDTKEAILNSMNKKIEKDLEKKRDIRDKKKVVDKLTGETEVSHGTSCPRIMSKSGDLIVEM